MFVAILYSIGPEVVLDCDFLDMGVVESGKFAAKSFKIINNAEVPAAFQVGKKVFVNCTCLQISFKYVGGPLLYYFSCMFVSNNN